MKRVGIGIYKLESGNYEFRYRATVNGKEVIKRKRKDEEGNKLLTKREAERARAKAMLLPAIHGTDKPKERKKVYEVYQEYCEVGRRDKAYTTKKKQDSLWKNHIKEKFGDRWVDEISVAEVNDYLTELYYVEERAYSYVECFLKIFYLIFGQAYDRDYLSFNDYNKLCLNRLSKIRMPKKRISEDDEIKIFSREQIKQLDEYFKGTNAEMAYLLGKNCGLRINECYGLKWDNVNLEEGTIYIDRQMMYQDGLIKLVSPKTRNAKRTLYMNKELADFVSSERWQQDLWMRESEAVRNQNQTFIIDLDNNLISSQLLVNCCLNGKIQTNNSMKYHSKKIKETLGIDFKYHYLRHTYGTRLAELNTPTHILCNQMGHASSKITEQYYLGQSKSGIEILKNNLEQL